MRQLVEATDRSHRPSCLLNSQTSCRVRRPHAAPPARVLSDNTIDMCVYVSE